MQTLTYFMPHGIHKHEVKRPKISSHPLRVHRITWGRAFLRALGSMGARHANLLFGLSWFCVLCSPSLALPSRSKILSSSWCGGLLSAWSLAPLSKALFFTQALHMGGSQAALAYVLLALSVCLLLLLNWGAHKEDPG